MDGVEIMHNYFLDEIGNYFESLTPVETEEGHTAVPQKPEGKHRWSGGEWVPEALTAEETAEEAENIRRLRNKRLWECDWTQVPDATVDQVAWAEYRQALRDITSQAGFPLDVTWPTKPE